MKIARPYQTHTRTDELRLGAEFQVQRLEKALCEWMQKKRKDVELTRDQTDAELEEDRKGK